jgi:hypothetical protein
MSLGVAVATLVEKLTASLPAGLNLPERAA